VRNFLSAKIEDLFAIELAIKNILILISSYTKLTLDCKHMDLFISQAIMPNIVLTADRLITKNETSLFTTSLSR